MPDRADWRTARMARARRRPHVPPHERSVSARWWGRDLGQSDGPHRRPARRAPGGHHRGARRAECHHAGTRHGDDRMNELPADLNERKEWLGRGWGYPIEVDPATGGVKLSAYEADIRQSIRIILGTAPGERVMRIDFGCGIHELVFESIDVALLTRIETAVRDALRTHEARIELLN